MGALLGYALVRPDNLFSTVTVAWYVVPVRIGIVTKMLLTSVDIIGSISILIVVLGNSTHAVS